MPAINLLVDPIANIVLDVAGTLFALSIVPKVSLQTTLLPDLSAIVADGVPELCSIAWIMLRLSAMVAWYQPVLLILEIAILDATRCEH